MRASAVKFSCATSRQAQVALSAQESLAFVLLFEGFLAVDVVHFDVGAPALPRQYFIASLVSAPVMYLRNLVVLFVDRDRVNSWRERRLGLDGARSHCFIRNELDLGQEDSVEPGKRFYLVVKLASGFT